MPDTPRAPRVAARFAGVLGCALVATAASALMPVYARSRSLLPDYVAVKSYNRSLAGYTRISHWVPGMGYHMGHLAPSLVLMVNNHGEVVGMEQSFPNTLPYHTWMDPKTTAYNAGRASYSQHLMFTPAATITPTMKEDLPSALVSFDRFKQVNGGHVIPYRRITPVQAGKGSVWGPDGPALRILLDSKEHVVGGVMAVPAVYGWQPWFDQPIGRPVADPILGRVYTQTVYLTRPSSIA
jgi:hypothetical protein